MIGKELSGMYCTMYEYYKVYCTIYYKTWVKPFWKLICIEPSTKE